MSNEEKQFGEMMQAAAPYMTLGLQIAIAVVLFVFIGKYVDDSIGTTPWGMVTGVAVGFTGGMIHFFRTVTELSKKEDHERRTKS